MTTWLVFLAYCYISYYTFSYSKEVWSEGKKFASFCIMLMAFSLIVLPIAVLFYMS